MLELVIDGTDGAGKTICAAILAGYLKDEGYTTALFSPYKEQEVYPLWEEQTVRAARIITRIMDRCRRQNQSKDIFLWDRGWPTAFITTNNREARALFHPLPPITLLLLHTEERTTQKTSRKNLQGTWVKDPGLIRKYNRAYHNLEEPENTTLVRYYPGKDGLFNLKEICREVQELIDFYTGERATPENH